MSNTLVVVVKIAAMFMVILVGWLARRRSYIDAKTTSLLATFTTDVSLPALVLTQMLQTVSWQTLKSGWLFPLLAIVVLLLGELIGWIGWRLFCTRRQAPTFIFAVSLANWIYLPLPIVQELYGPAGVQILLLCNIGAQVALWTLGVATLHGGRLDRSAMLSLVKNPGLIATLLGILLGITLPAGNGVGAVGLGSLAGKAVFEGLALLGSLTVPLALVLIGAQLGAIPLAGSRPDRPLSGIVFLRLVCVPLAALGLIWLVQHSGRPLPRMPVAILFLIAAMPVAVNCSILTDRFAQDARLAAQSVFYSTLLSIVTVPVGFWLFNVLVP